MTQSAEFNKQTNKQIAVVLFGILFPFFFRLTFDGSGRGGRRRKGQRREKRTGNRSTDRNSFVPSEDNPLGARLSIPCPSIHPGSAEAAPRSALLVFAWSHPTSATRISGEGRPLVPNHRSLPLPFSKHQTAVLLCFFIISSSIHGFPGVLLDSPSLPSYLFRFSCL